MKTPEQLADEYEANWHKQYPDGVMVADYCNRDVPYCCFLDGHESRDEEVKVLRRALEKISRMHVLDDGAKMVAIAEKALEGI